MDQENASDHTEELTNKIITAASKIINDVDGIILQDYNKGLLNGFMSKCLMTRPFKPAQMGPPSHSVSWLFDSLVTFDFMFSHATLWCPG